MLRDSPIAFTSMDSMTEEEVASFLQPHENSDEFPESGDSDSDFGIFTKKARKSLIQSRTRKLCAYFVCSGVALIILVLVVFCVGLLVGHYGIPSVVHQSVPAGPVSKPTASVPGTVECNTTTTPNIRQEICDDPPLLIISLDGFRASYFSRNITPFLDKFASEGVRAAYMRSAYPTKTFPNHFSIVTGLYPESHGIVSNHFHDSIFNDRFDLGSRNQNDPKWWRGEPVWVTAAKNELKTGTFFWPGSAARIQNTRPDYFIPYDNYVTYEERIARVLSWLDYPKSLRPQFVTMYFDEPDESGHIGGPDSLLVEQAIRRVDNAVQSLFAGLEERGIMDCVNVMIVSDHGMGTFNESLLVYLPNHIPLSLADNVTYPSYGPVASVDTIGDSSVLQDVFDSLVSNGSDLPLRVFLTDTIPYRLHAGHFNKERYGQIHLIGDLSSFISPIAGLQPVIGKHGYDNIYEEMHAIFQARGPAFKTNYTCQAFDNIQLYSLMCGLLGIPPADNNGTTGSLYHALTPSVVAKLPPAQVYTPVTSPPVNVCSFPMNDSVYSSRVLCEGCVCYGGGGGAVGCDGVTNSTIDDANRALNVMPSTENMYQQTHLPWGVPTGGIRSGACFLSQQHYVSLYSNELHIPLWTAYQLTKAQQTLVSSSSCSRRDPRLSTNNSANCTQFTSLPIFNVTVGDLAYSRDPLLPVRMVAGLSSVKLEEISTSLLSNFVPQSQTFNTKVWTPLQAQLKQWANVFNIIHVISGVVIDTDRDGLSDSNPTWWTGEVGSIAVPTHFYTIVVRCLDEGLEPSACTYNDLDVLGLLFDHPLPPGDWSDSSRMLRFGLTPVRDIEKLTGINFFPQLSTQDQNMLELRIVNYLWPIT